MDQDILYFVCLLDLDANSYTVNARLDQDFLVLIAGDGERIKEDFRGAGSFNLGNVVPF